MDIDSVKEYAKSKADGIVYNLVDDLGRVLRNYDILIWKRNFMKGMRIWMIFNIPEELWVSLLVSIYKY